MSQSSFILISIFLGLFLFSCSCYIFIFLKSKHYFNKQIDLTNKYNQLISKWNSINFLKIETLIKNNLSKTKIFDNLKNEHKKIEVNIKNLFANIKLFNENVLNETNLQTFNSNYKIIFNELKITLINVENFQKIYNSYTQYPDTIIDIYQSYSASYMKLKAFYEKKIFKPTNFKQTNQLINLIGLSIENIPNLWNKFDLNKTTRSLVSLKSRINLLSKLIQINLKYQILNNYLQVNFQINEKIIVSNKMMIDNYDLENLHKIFNEYSENYENFITNFHIFNLTKIELFCINAISLLEQLIKFALIHTKTPIILQNINNEINQQTSKIIDNEDKVINSCKKINKYLTPSSTLLEQWTKIVIDETREIIKLKKTANAINKKTYYQKISGLKIATNTCKLIWEKKEKISNVISQINNHLQMFISLLTNINDLIVIFWQLKNYSENLMNKHTKEQLNTLINENLTMLDQYSHLLFNDKNSNYSVIKKEIDNITKQLNFFYKKINLNRLYQMYSNCLFLYTNRYKDDAQFSFLFAEANKAYEQKEYIHCLDTLLLINKKKQKNKTFSLKYI